MNRGGRTGGADDPVLGAIEVGEESIEALAGYATIPIAFDVRVVLDVRGSAPSFRTIERPIETPMVKDYDALDGGPTTWPERFDLSQWQLFAARVGAERLGGAAAYLDDRDTAILWDIRVTPTARGRGVGSALFDAVARWARDRGRARLLVETQNINAPACRFYARHGCTLERVERGAYPDLPDEVKLVWLRMLPRSQLA